MQIQKRCESPESIAEWMPNEPSGKEGKSLVLFRKTSFIKDLPERNKHDRIDK